MTDDALSGFDGTVVVLGEDDSHGHGRDQSTDAETDG